MTTAPQRENTANSTSPPEPHGSEQESIAAGQKKNANAARLRKLLDNRWVVLGLIFFAMMFLGIPLIWQCRAFSLVERIFWTLAALLYTAVVFWLFYLVMRWAYHSIAASLGYG
jgi:cation transport ATPase